MRICIAGGIFDKPPQYRAKHAISPETVLAGGLREQGWDVSVCGQRQPLQPLNFDLIHVHHFGRNALRLALDLRRAPLIFTTHDPFAMNGLPIGWKRRLTDGLILKRANAIVALSTPERDFLVRRYGLPPASVAVIPNGISTHIFDRIAEPEQGREDLLFVGQLQPFKGLPYLLEALPAVIAAFPHTRLRVVYQTDTLLEPYRRLTGRLGIAGHIEFAGPKTPSELAALYSTAAVVVSPSLGEALSTVVLEAMCCGAAVVATDVGGIREQLDPSTGIIVPPRDSAALAQAICRLLANPGWRRALGDAARRKARAQFSVHQMIRRHVRLYEQVLGAYVQAA